MEIDEAKVDDAVLALLALFRFDGARSWKGYEFEVMDRLHARGLIDDPRGRAKSVWLTPEGVARGEQVARQLFGTPTRE